MVENAWLKAERTAIIRIAGGGGTAGIEFGAGTLGQFGRLTGRDPATLSSAAKRLQRPDQKDLQ
jgi:hypothetical protein